MTSAPQAISDLVERFARHLLAQGIRVRLDEAGFPVIDGGQVSGIVETQDETLRPLIAKTVYRLQQSQR
jgi:hypothetical protein